ncbi:MAG: hypothetical protein K2M83_06725 [Muribaculaceae bacterium]|nr:hypothetical protein [Muribaculaceae bacterium]
MDLPSSLYASTVAEGKMYFFKSDCPIGIKDHIHICIKRGNTIFLFATGSSQIEKAIRRAKVLGYDLNTYPVFPATSTNRLKKPQTYIDCNHPIESTHEEFANLIKSGKIYELTGIFDEDSLQLIRNGVKLSSIVEERIKQMI